jgi:hypothetical protein
MPPVRGFLRDPWRRRQRGVFGDVSGGLRAVALAAAGLWPAWGFGRYVDLDRTPRLAVVRRLDRDVGEKPVEPAGDVPRLLTQQREECRYERHPHDQRVSKDRDGEKEPELLRDAIRAEDERREDGAHDQRRSDDHAPDRRDAVLDVCRGRGRVPRGYGFR